MNEKRDISLAGVSVLIGMPIHRGIPAVTHISMLNTLAACASYRIPIDVITPNGSSVVMTARNQTAHAYLKQFASHLFWIDSDIQWSVDQFLRVLAMATVCDTARAVYPRRQERIVFDRDGLGFCCVQRKVMEALADAAPSIFFGEVEPCKAIFRESFVKTDEATAAGADYEYFAEDATFFADCERLGFTSWIDPRSSLGHVGEKVYRASLDERWEIVDGTADRSREEPRQEGIETGARGLTKLVTLDMNPDHNPDVLHDLENIPLPFEDNTFDEIHAYEVLEHVGRQGDYKFFFAQFSDFWRILKAGGVLCGTSPSPSTSVWAWGDPGHTRIISKECFLFLNQEEYAQVGRTVMSDYRFIYKADFDPVYMEASGPDNFAFVLQALWWEAADALEQMQKARDDAIRIGNANYLAVSDRLAELEKENEANATAYCETEAELTKARDRIAELERILEEQQRDADARNGTARIAELETAVDLSKAAEFEQAVRLGRRIAELEATVEAERKDNAANFMRVKELEGALKRK